MGNRRKIAVPTPRRPVVHDEGTIKRMHDIQATFSGKYNGYICETCDKGYLTLDIDHGTTPAVQPCFATEGCKGEAKSLGYPEGEPPEFLGEPIIHWYKPSNHDGLTQESIDYVVSGGLLRKTTSYAPGWVRAIA